MCHNKIVVEQVQTVFLECIGLNNIKPRYLHGKTVEDEYSDTAAAFSCRPSVAVGLFFSNELTVGHPSQLSFV